ncbi:hypothetical protein WSM22_34270 [Cytophagales bacterium WSM2-2]|nr:hypothetical protein WSM22_34270 [Cytophagales bacterium WSM2-2]
MKKLKQLTGYLSLTVVMFSLWVMSGCTKSSDAGPVFKLDLLIATPAYQQSTTVTDDKALDSLVKYLTVYPDLITLLDGSDQYTLFAPSNKAFKNLLATPGFPTDIKLINPAIIQGVLSYHLVAGQKTQAQLTSGLSMNSLYTDPTTSTVQTIVVNSDGTLKTGSTNTSIHITVGDQKATNGVMHIVESVMIPPTVGASLTPILGTVAGDILLGAAFTDIAKIITKADATFTESAANGAFKITTWLAMPISASGAVTANATGITFFAIPNTVFQAGAVAAGKSEADFVAQFMTTSDAARALLLNHLATSAKYVITPATGATTITNSSTITTKGKSISVLVTTISTQTGPYGYVLTNANTSTASSSAYIALKDQSKSNGVIQVIAGILK